MSRDGPRLGEMERDALLAHGVAYLVHDRLFHCSDEARALVCTRCGSLLAPMMRPPEGALSGPASRETLCRACGVRQHDASTPAHRSPTQEADWMSDHCLHAKIVCDLYCEAVPY